MKKILLIASLLFISCIYAQQQDISSLRLDRSIKVIYDENAIQEKTEIAFDANGNLTLYIEYDWDDTTQYIIPKSKSEYTYDANGNQILEISYYWNANTQSFVPNSKYEATYDAKGNFSFYIVYSWDDITQSFVPSYKSESTYDANDKETSAINYSWDYTTQSYVLAGNTEIDSNGNETSYINYSWNDKSKSFAPEDKHEYTYDANGNETLYIPYYWDDTTQSFAPFYKRESTYDANGKLTLRTNYSWNTVSKSIAPEDKQESTYDVNGNNILYISYLWNNTTQSFVPLYKQESTYDGDGKPTGWKIYSWDDTTQYFVPKSKSVLSYYNGLFLNDIIYKWYPELGVYRPSFKTEYTTILDTDTQLHRMGVLYQYDTNFNVWKKLEREELKSYQYNTKTELSTQTIENNLITLYPNPTSKLLYVSHTELNSLGIQIVDVNGKQMYSGTIQKDVPLDISSYTRGLYLVTIENKETKKKNTYKIIKK